MNRRLPISKHLSLATVRWSLVRRMGLTVVFALWTALAIGEDSARTPVILVSVDTLRADRLSSYGCRQIRTPHIDALTQGGTLLSQVSALVPLTLPSHVSLLTSTYPFANGLEDNGEHLQSDAVTLTTILKSRGYRTAAFVGGFVLDRRFGLNQGFDDYDSPFDLRQHSGTDPGDIKRLGQDVAHAATSWLEQNSSGPFFLFLHLYDLHTPYTLPPSVRARYPGPGYQAELEYVDDVLGNFWEFLQQRGIFEKTLILFTSDHGEGLGDHEENTHGYFIYQSTLHVPLIIHWPAATGPYPARIAEPTTLLDVAPTILQFLGIPRPPQFQGRSLLSLLTKGSNSGTEEVYSESLYGHKHFGVAALRSLRIGRYKYIEVPKPEFYDLEKDADEKVNLYFRHKAMALEFRGRLRSLRTRYKPSQHAGQQALSPEAVELLSSLGYISGSGNHSAAQETGADPKDRIVDYEKYGAALALASRGSLAEANDLFKDLLAEHPDLWDVHITLGLNLQKLGRHREAVESFRKVLKAEPLNVLAHFDLGVSYFALGQLDDAEKELRATLALAPYYTRADEALGAICMQRNDYDGAISHYRHILVFAPDDYTAHYNLGVLGALKGQWEQGERHLHLALQADPQSSEALNALGSFYLERGDLDQARERFIEAVRLEPNFAGAHYNLGLVYRRQNKIPDAIREFRQALAANPALRAAGDALNSLEPSRK